MVANNAILSIMTIAFSIFFLVYAHTLPEGRPGATTWGPADWPTLVLILMLIMGILLLIKTFTWGKKDTGAAPSTNGSDQSEGENDVETEILEPEVVYPRRYWVIFGMLIVYTLLMGYIGFAISTLLFVFLVTQVMGMKRWLSSLVTTILSTPAVIFVFANLLAVPLPRGIGIFRELSFLIY